MDKESVIGFDQALKITLENISPISDGHIVGITQGLDRVVSKDLYAKTSSPSIDASKKDGYAVLSDDIRHVSEQNKVQLKVVDTAAAGSPARRSVISGTAIRILTGAKIPDGANAVLAEEFTDLSGDVLTVFNTAEPGRNILPKGADVDSGELIISRGTRLTPGMIGLLVASGYDRIPVFALPKVAILATGDELVRPGMPLSEGKLYASNMEMLNAWCQRYNIPATVAILDDKPDFITDKIAAVIETHDVVITSGGAWTGDRDFVAETLDRLGWKKQFHRIRIGPGKAVGFGKLNQKPVFLLPGGPPSNLMAFLQIALPGILKLGGYGNPSLPRMMVKLTEKLTCRHINWTEFKYGLLESEKGYTVFKPLKLDNRLKTMAMAQGIVTIPEGVKFLPEGAMVSAQILT